MNVRIGRTEFLKGRATRLVRQVRAEVSLTNCRGSDGW